MAVKTHFTAAEAEDLATLLAFFDREVCGDTALAACYEHAFTKPLPIPFTQQKAMLDSLSSPLPYQIWVRGWQKQGTDSLAFLFYTPQDHYLAYLQSVAADEKTLEPYLSELTAYGDVSAKATRALLQAYQAAGVSDPRIRVVHAIHWLTLHDQQNRDEVLPPFN